MEGGRRHSCFLLTPWHKAHNHSQQPPFTPSTTPAYSPVTVTSHSHCHQSLSPVTVTSHCHQSQSPVKVTSHRVTSHNHQSQGHQSPVTVTVTVTVTSHRVTSHCHQSQGSPMLPTGRYCYHLHTSAVQVSCKYGVHPSAVAMVLTKVKPILFSGECYMGN